MANKMITVFTVQKIRWEYGDDFYYNEGQDCVKTFLSRDKAEVHRQELEQAALAERTPNIQPEFGNLLYGERCSLPYAEAVEWLQAVGITPPEDEKAFPAWFDAHWEEGWESLHSEQRQAMLELIDRVPIYRLVEMQLEVRGE